MITPQRFDRFQRKTIDGSVQALTLEEWAIADFRSSGISEDYARINFEMLQGDAAVEILTEHAIAEVQSVHYVTKPARRILDRYQFAAQGGWVAMSASLDGIDMPSAYFKPIAPRREKGGFGTKSIKYETPAKSAAHPLLPSVTWEVGLKIAQQHNLETQYHQRFADFNGFGLGAIDSQFWNWWKEINAPVTITEGWKKAVKLTEMGQPTITLRGIACWHLKGDKQTLHSILEAFATPGRKITIVFDQDVKVKTIIDVNRQINELGETLRNRGCQVQVLEWTPSQGKGIDDAIVNQGKSAEAWLEVVFATAPTLDEFKKDALIRKCKRIITRLNALSITPDRATEGGYMPQLPEAVLPRKITVLAGNPGAGKTVRIGEDLIQAWIAQGGNVIVLGMLNSLGFQNARQFNIPHIGHYNLAEPDERKAFYSDISYRHGVALCFDSLLKIPDWFYDRPVMLVLDEVNQGLEHLLLGRTLGDKQPEVLEKFSEIAAKAGRNGAIVVAEAEVYDRSTHFLKTVSGIENVQYFKHWRNNAPWKVRIGSGSFSGFLPSIGDPLGQDGAPLQKFLYVTASQKNARLVERIYRLRYPDKAIVRIDSETNREGQFDLFFDDPTEYLNQQNVEILILSPSAKTGVSITWEGFDAVFGCFQCLDTLAHEQLLSRYRPAVPRYVFISEFIRTSGDEGLGSPIAIENRQQRNAEGFAKLYEIEASSAPDNWRSQIALAAMQFCREASVVKGCQKVIAREALCDRLKAIGHSVVETRWENNQQVTEEVRSVRFSLWDEEAQTYAASRAYFKDEGSLDLDLAHQILSQECSLEQQIRAEKTLLIHEFPGIDFDNQQTCYWALSQQWGNMARGLRKQIQAEFAHITHANDCSQVQRILSHPLGLYHHLPRRYMQAALRQKLGIINLALDFNSEFSNKSPRLLELKRLALQFKAEIRYWLGLTIADEYQDAKGRKRHTPINIASKLLRQLGLELKPVRKPGKKGERQRFYKLQCAIKPKSATSKEQEQQAAWAARSHLLCAARERFQQLEANLSPPEFRPAPDKGSSSNSSSIIRHHLENGARQEATDSWWESKEYQQVDLWRQLSPQEKAILQNDQRATA